MTLPRFALSLIVATCSMTFVVGCGGPDGPTFHPVKGKVTLDGEPVVGAEVAFFPKDEEGGPQSGGTTNEQGEFELFGPVGKNGAVAGEHMVSVSCPFDVTMGSAGDGQDPGEEKESSCKIPLTYSDIHTSGLTQNVPEGGKQDVVIDLSSDHTM